MLSLKSMQSTLVGMLDMSHLIRNSYLSNYHKNLNLNKLHNFVVGKEGIVGQCLRALNNNHSCTRYRYCLKHSFDSKQPSKLNTYYFANSKQERRMCNYLDLSNFCKNMDKVSIFRMGLLGSTQVDKKYKDQGHEDSLRTTDCKAHIDPYMEDNLLNIADIP